MERPPIPPLPTRIDVSPALRLDALTGHDCAELYALTEANRERLRAWLPWLDVCTEPAHTLDYLGLCERHREAGTGFYLGIRERGTLAGVVSYNWIHAANRSAAIGYWMGGEHVGRGLMSQACAALVDHGFGFLGLNRQMIAAATENRRSRAVAERLGFRFEGVQRQAEWLYDHYVDHACYALLRADWAAMRPARR